MDVLNLKCLNCGAKLDYNNDSKVLRCEFCGASFLIDDDVLKFDTESAKKAGYEFEKGRFQAQKEISESKENNTPPTANNDELDSEECSEDGIKQQADNSDTNSSSKPSSWSLFSDIVEICVTAITVVIVCFAFFARNAVVDGESMRETLQDRDSLIVLSFGFKPKTGDIIVCQSENYGYETPLVKRVIATSGQTISLDREKWQVYVDGVPLDERDYVRYLDGVRMNGWAYGDTYIVPDGYVFVMGDNRNNSTDSRSTHIGPIDERLVVGKVILRYLPFGKAKVF